jgi:hypothetical protein
MDRRTFITTGTAAAVGLASNPTLTTRAQGKQPRPTLTEGFWPNKARLVISFSMQFETGPNRITEPGVPFRLLIQSTPIYPHKNGTTMVLKKAFRVCSTYGTASESK